MADRPGWFCTSEPVTGSPIVRVEVIGEIEVLLSVCPGFEVPSQGSWFLGYLVDSLSNWSHYDKLPQTEILRNELGYSRDIGKHDFATPAPDRPPFGQVVLPQLHIGGGASVVAGSAAYLMVFRSPEALKSSA